ncbi:MAG: dipicolinate synthase subunit DpsA [Firmicutes bacterium]|nr:dipicolinate synthase subunit DpsA [Bacillota bacterium]
MVKTISVIGGDLRQLTLYNLLLQSGCEVCLQGFDKLADVQNTNDIAALSSSDVIILPMPVTIDGVYVNSVYSDAPIRLDELIDAARPSAVFFGGQIKDDLAAKFNEKNIRFYDYLTREELAVKNAVATAEGAIGIAMSETPFTLHRSDCLVLGYGRIGKVLSKMLLGIGARVTVAARRHSDLAMAECNDCAAVNINDLRGNIHNYSIIFNTVPAVILDYPTLRRVNRDALIIDLASRPGGVDFETAKKLGLKVIWALSLPGKVAPVTSGKIIKDTILNILNELEV